MKKNGFTMVELLAVIAVIGLIFMLAVTNVIPVMRKSKNKGFINDAITLSEAGRIKYADDKLTNNTADDKFSGSVAGKRCYSIENSLIGNYASDLNTKLKGSVEICFADSCTYQSKIWVSNGTIHMAGKTDEELESITENDIKNTTYNDHQFKNCGT